MSKLFDSPEAARKAPDDAGSQYRVRSTSGVAFGRAMSIHKRTPWWGDGEAPSRAERRRMLEADGYTVSDGRKAARYTGLAAPSIDIYCIYGIIR
jgi:hypothetical protein